MAKIGEADLHLQVAYVDQIWPYYKHYCGNILCFLPSHVMLIEVYIHKLKIALSHKHKKILKKKDPQK